MSIKKSKIENHIPLHWILLFNLLITLLILLIGGTKINQDINQAAFHSSDNLKHSKTTTQLIEQLVNQQLQLRRVVMEQKILVNRFAYEFGLFVAKEDGKIEPLTNAFNRMIANYKILESFWMNQLPTENLKLLKAYTKTTIGIYEEASEFSKIGFGEIYRLAQESNDVVYTLIALMNKIVVKLDQYSEDAALKVSQDSIIVLQNEDSLMGLLKSITHKNQVTLIIIFTFLFLFQIFFLIFFKRRIFRFTRMTQIVSVEGNLTERINLNSKDEFGKLATSFNKMLDNLQATTISKSLLKNIIESMDDIILVVSQKGTIKIANESSNRNYVIENKSLIGTSLYDYFDSDKNSIVDIITNRKNVVNQEKYFKIGSNKEITVLFSASPLIQDRSQGTENDVICVIRDITDRIKIEREKIKAEKIAAEQLKYALIGQVAGKMAHDFNNVLGIIMGNVELALLDCNDSEMKKTFRMIFDQTIRGKNLTKNLVAFAKSQEPKQEFFKINEKINLVLNLLKKDLSGIELIIEESDGQADLLADPGMIEHALVNLIQNSIHAISKEENPKICFRTYCSEEFIYFEIEDNGCGMPEEYIGKIFEPSFTLKGGNDHLGLYKAGIKGTGYGMSNVKKYIDQHKGKISVKSKLGMGTKFVIQLPLVNKQLSSKEKREVIEEIVYVRKNILLVEDEIAISDVQYRILTDDPCNHTVDLANNGETAINLFNKNEYDFVSLDYILPGSINGIDVYNHIRKTNSSIPILFISGNIEFIESTKELRQKDPNIECVSKPCRNKDYIHEINSLFAKVSG